MLRRTPPSHFYIRRLSGATPLPQLSGGNTAPLCPLATQRVTPNTPGLTGETVQPTSPLVKDSPPPLSRRRIGATPPPYPWDGLTAPAFRLDTTPTALRYRSYQTGQTLPPPHLSGVRQFCVGQKQAPKSEIPVPLPPTETGSLKKDAAAPVPGKKAAAPVPEEKAAAAPPPVVPVSGKKAPSPEANLHIRDKKLFGNVSLENIARLGRKLREIENNMPGPVKYTLELIVSIAAVKYSHKITPIMGKIKKALGIPEPVTIEEEQLKVSKKMLKVVREIRDELLEAAGKPRKEEKDDEEEAAGKPKKEGKHDDEEEK